MLESSRGLLVDNLTLCQAPEPQPRPVKVTLPCTVAAQIPQQRRFFFPSFLCRLELVTQLADEVLRMTTASTGAAQ